MSSSSNSGALGARLAAPERPTKDDATGLAGLDGVTDHTKNNDQDRSAETERLATARAVLARFGHVVHKLAGGGFLVTWRGLSRECRDLVELEAHARCVGALP